MLSGPTLAYFIYSTGDCNCFDAALKIHDKNEWYHNSEKIYKPALVKISGRNNYV